MNKDIKVDYLYGIKRKQFFELEKFGYEVDIPEEKEQIPIYAHIGEASDYLLLFSIYFSLKIVDEISKGIANKLVSNFAKTIRNVWGKFNDSAPAVLVSGKEPNYKLPKATLRFQISEDEVSIIEITKDINPEDLEILLNFQLDLIKMQYRHRKKESKLKNKIKK